MSLWNSIWTQKATLWASGKLQTPEGFQESSIEADEVYVSSFLKSMYITHVRRGLKKFYGTVHSFVSIPHLSGQTAEFHVVTTPTSLKGLTNSNLNKIVQLNCPILGPIPYRGGNITLEAGLFSIPYENLSDSYLNLLEKMSTTAGVSFVNSAIPFARLLGEGINALTGAGGGDILEIGIKATLDKPTTGYYFVMAAPKDKIKTKNLRLDTADYSLTDETGKSITEYSYMVYSLEADPKRETWFQIPDLSKAYQPFKVAMEAGSATAAEENFIVFKRTVVNSPDLLLKDGINLVKKLEAEKNAKLAVSQTKGQKIWMPSLAQIDLYSK